MTDDLVNRPSFYGYLQKSENKEMLRWLGVDLIFTNPDWLKANPIKPYDVVYSDAAFPISMLKHFDDIGLEKHFVITDDAEAIEHWRKILQEYYTCDFEMNANPYYRMKFVPQRQNTTWVKAQQFKNASKKLDALERQYGSKSKTDLAYYQEY